MREKDVRDQKVFKVVGRQKGEISHLPILEGAAGGEEDDQGGELRLLLGDDGETQPQPAFQVKVSWNYLSLINSKSFFAVSVDTRINSMWHGSVLCRGRSRNSRRSAR